MATQQCQHCHEIKDETEFHWKWKDVERLKVCKACRKQDSKRYRDGSVEKRLAYNKRYTEAHREEISKYMKIYHDTHREETTRRLAERVDDIAERAAIYYREHKDELIKRKKEWSKEHPERAKLYSERRRAHKFGAEIIDFSDKQWDEVLIEYNYGCAYCGATTVLLQRDHIIPISKGGNHTKSNIVPACISCNSSKKDKLLKQWKRTLYFRENCSQSKL